MNHLTFDAFRLLCNSLEDVKLQSNENIRLFASQATLPGIQRQTCLELLPSELLGEIFALLSPEDFLGLVLCSQILWDHALTWAKRAYARWRNEYSWVNTPVICAGSHLQNLPDVLYDTLPEAISGERTSEEEDEELGRHETQTKSKAKLWFHEAVDSYERIPLPYDYSYLEELEHRIQSAGIPETFHKSIKACLPIFGIKTGSRWYLRNLTEKEYIQMEAVNTSDGEFTIALPGHSWLNVDILVLWFISWRGDNGQYAWNWEGLEDWEGFTDHNLSDTWHDGNYGPVDHHFWPVFAGPWAGHNLDVVTQRELDTDWTDRTKWIEPVAPKLLRLFY
ncbi:hypothetical protein LZL87_010752 [Fusarium oxysporum]|nr:hypothetical protein LZL87_010752 [Fusarium oxysporum]